MKQISAILISLSFIFFFAYSCKNPVSTKNVEKALCPRNVYSRNGVETVYYYNFEAKEGEVDPTSKKLYSVERYDSLGNVIYYKGGYYPSVAGVDFSTFHYEVRSELDLSWDAEYTYKLEYNDTVFVKASLFDGDGNYIARVEQFVKDNSVIDSVFVRDRLIYVRKAFKDVKGRDSLILSYDNKYDRDLSLAEEERYSYVTSGNSVRTDYVRKSRDFDYKRTHKFETTKGSYETHYNESGQLIKGDYGGIWTSYTYDERGFNIESITGNDYRKTKTLYKSTFYDNGLYKNGYTYADMTVCTSYSEFEYTFYPYSQAVLE